MGEKKLKESNYMKVIEDSKSIEFVLEKFREESKDTTDLGNKFEILIKKALLHDPSIAGEFEQVWLWKDFPYKDDTDTGIDLVGYTKQSNQYIAIQCKCYNSKTYLGDISSFMAKANTTFKVENKKISYSGMILFSTTDAIASHAEKSFKEQKLPTSIINVSDLNKSKLDWSECASGKFYIRPKKDITQRPYQPKAIEACVKGFKKADRGKLIMACGTGKTFTSLKFTEAQSKKGDFVLFLVPSIALMSQTIREWLQEKGTDINVFAVCSDKTVGKNKDAEDLNLHDIPYLATTDMNFLKNQLEATDKKRAINVIFSTYQSIEVIIEAQKKKVLPNFNLTICDEAHRTTGFNLGKTESHFTKVHHDVLSSKRLYMTATPRIYKIQDKTKVKIKGGEFYSMDEEKDYGQVFFRYGFSEAVDQGFLSDYKVMVLAIPEKILSKQKQESLSNEDQEIEVSDRAKIIGCYQGLQKKYINKCENSEKSKQAMKRAVAFVRTIKDSERLVEKFQDVIDEENMDSKFRCSSQHIDGSMNSSERERKISWLKEEPKKDECRILFNARCLSEGVDVPALDSVIFLNPKNSEIEVVQSVGRVMRKAEGKDFGYIVIPVVIPYGVKPSEALSDNKKYKVIWQVIQALRSHDDKLKNEINRIEFNKESKKVIVDTSLFGVKEEESQLNFDLVKWKDAIYAQIVSKCGDRMYWDDWAKDIATVATQYVSTIEDLLKKDPKRREYFNEFLGGLRKMLNPSVGEEDAIKLVAQHLISKPIFESLFSNSRSLENSSVFQGIEKFIKDIDLQTRTDVKSLNEVYKAINKKSKGISDLTAKQKIIKDLYSKFFEKSFAKDSEKLGIVYTPIQVIDFMIHSVEYILNKEFNESLNDRDLNILEPFAGSGSFITRLLQSGLIKNDNFAYKFENNIFSNEVLLLAHYISQVNIEETFSSVTGLNKSFSGGVLTDTFQLEENTIDQNKFFPINSKKIIEQKQKNFKVIIGNPPYRSGQKSGNDANQNTIYPKIRSRIEATYAEESKAGLKNSLYDPYIQAFRLASDKLEKNDGVISFIHNASLLDGGSTDGFRKCLEKEFDSIYLLNLRGNCNLKGRIRKREGESIFGQSSRTPICISFLVKNQSNKKEKADIYYYDIGDYLKREEKLSILNEFQSIKNIDWKKITPNEKGCWIKQGDKSFDDYLPIGDNKNKEKNTIFDFYSCGVNTSRDPWAYNFSKKEVSKNMKQMIDFYNQEIERLKNKKIDFKSFDYKTIAEHLDRDLTKVKWSRAVNKDLIKNKEGVFKKSHVKISNYRPFMKSYLYLDRMFSESVSQNPKIWLDPKGNAIENKAICVSGNGAKVFSVLMSDAIPNYHYMDTSQTFPQYYFDKDGSLQESINDTTLNQFKSHYKDSSINKEDIFNYVYGVLNSKDYQIRYKNNLSKDLPRIPLCKDFKNFSRIGKELSELHLNYENQKKLKEVKILKNGKEIDIKSLDVKALKVEKMKFNKKDKSTIQFNACIAILNIPEKAWDYKINDWSAIKWIVEKYQVKIDKKTGIKNDPNAYNEDPFYILKLLLSVITLSVKTKELIASLPVIDFEGLGVADNKKVLDKNFLIKRALIYTMMSDGKLQDAEKKRIVIGYKQMTGYLFPKAEFESHLKSLDEGDWSEKSLLDDFKDLKLSGNEKEDLLEEIIRVIISDEDSDPREIQFLQKLASSLNYPEADLQEIISGICSKVS